MLTYTGARSGHIYGNSATLMFPAMDQIKRDRFSSYFQTLRIVSRIYDAQQSIFGKVLGVWKFGDILSLVRYVLSKKTKAMEKTKTFAKKLTVTGFKIRYPDQSR